jgi:hypothetical protein
MKHCEKCSICLECHLEQKQAGWFARYIVDSAADVLRGSLASSPQVLITTLAPSKRTSCVAGFENMQVQLYVTTYFASYKFNCKARGTGTNGYGFFSLKQRGCNFISFKQLGCAFVSFKQRGCDAVG